MTPADKAFETRITRLASRIADRITALPDNDFLEGVVRVFAEAKGSAMTMEYVYHQLDNNPRWFGPTYNNWFPKLRSTRNHPVHGERLFAAIRRQSLVKPWLCHGKRFDTPEEANAHAKSIHESKGIFVAVEYWPAPLKRKETAP